MPDMISSRANPRVKMLAEQARKPNRNAFVVEGFHMVEMAAEYGYLDEIFALKDPKVKGVKTTLVTSTIIDKIALSKNPEPIIGLAHGPKSKELASERALVLDRVQDPGNIGTIMRTALSFGFTDVVFLPGTCSPYNGKSLSSSQGAVFGLNCLFPSTVEEAFALLKEKGYFILGSALRGAVPLETYAFPEGKIALVLGNEGKGMGEFFLTKSDKLVKISMNGIESLNVGVAGGILMHSLSIDSWKK